MVLTLKVLVRKLVHGRVHDKRRDGDYDGHPHNARAYVFLGHLREP